MKFGVNTFIWSERFDRTHIGLLESIARAGFNGIELPLIAEHPTADDVIRRALQDHDLECTFASIVPPGLNTISDDPEIRERTRLHWLDCIRVASEMGGQIICGPLYSPVGYLPGRRRTAEEWKWAVDCFQQLGPALEQHGVTLALEPLNRYETYFLNTTADSVFLCRDIAHPRVGLLFDTYHANIEEKSLADAIRGAGSHLAHFHSCANDRGIPGTGHIDWPPLFEALRDIGYQRWLTIEGFGFSAGPLSAAASIWRDLAPTPDSIAFEGLKFLRSAKGAEARWRA